MTTKKLPVWAIVRDTYRSVREHADALGALSRGTATAATIALVLSFAAVQLILSDERRGAAFLELPAGERVAAYTSRAMLMVFIGLFVIIVRWHRMIVRDLAPRATRAGATRAALLYFARSLLLGSLGVSIGVVCALLPVTLTRGLPLSEDVRWWITVAFVIGGIVAALVTVGRLSLILPAGAVGDYHVTMGRAWHMSRGNAWRILAGSVLASGPVFFANVVFNGFIEAMPSMSGNVASLLAMLTLSLLLFVLTAVVQASFLSYAYRFLSKANDGG